MFNNYLGIDLYNTFRGEVKRGHTYCLCVEGLGKVKTSYYHSRMDANRAMYHIMNRKGATIRDIYDDKHDKTYICTRGIKFYITRQ